MTARVYIVGTDTGVGKTNFTCALLRAAAGTGSRFLPYKPAVSGELGPNGDSARLIAASGGSITVKELSPLRYDAPLAPGIAEDPHPFVDSPALDSPPHLPGEIHATLIALETRLRPDFTVIEGAGGLEVPMPAGTWQIQWIRELQCRPLIVARAGLGTINHTLLTIAELRRHDLEPMGFVTVDTVGTPDPSCTLNARVISARSETAHLAHLPHSAHEHPDLDPALSDALSSDRAPLLWRALRSFPRP